MTSVWCLTRSKDGAQIWLREIPLWAYLATEAGEWLMEATHPVFCCPPEWAYKLAWAPPPADEEPDETGYVYNPNTVGHALHEVADRLASGFGAWRKYTSKAFIPVTEEWVRENFPEETWLFEDPDEMHAEPNDDGDVQL